MEGTNCNGEGGWTRIAFVNMSQPGATCPTGLTQIEQSNLTLCSRNDTNEIQSAFFTTLGLNYTAVCGRVRGYQLGRTGAFAEFTMAQQTIDEPYVTGVSITHGASPRQHIWTYAAGFTDASTAANSCPCNNGSIQRVPTFVGENYYCEAGSDTNQQGVLYINDPLWDGMQCNNREDTCCTNPNLPWFNTAPQETTNDDIELRLLFHSSAPPGISSPLQLIELYIR